MPRMKDIHFSQEGQRGSWQSVQKVLQGAAVPRLLPQKKLLYSSSFKSNTFAPIPFPKSITAR